MNAVIDSTGLLFPFATILAAACTCAFGAGVAAGVWSRNRLLATRGAAPSARVVAPREPLLVQRGDQFAGALELARGSGPLVPDEEQIVETIVATFGWSRIRARWFIAINRDQLTA